MAIILQSDLENLLQINVTAEPDTTVAWYIAAAQAAAETYCHRSFDYAAATVETLDGDGQSTIIQLDRYPVITLTSVVESGTTLTSGTDYVSYLTTGIVKRTSGGRIVRAWRNDLQGIVATYDGGYQVDQAGDGATAPSDLVHAITRIAGRLFKTGAAPISGPALTVTLDGIGGVTYANVDSLVDLPLLHEEETMLIPYLNPGLV